MARPSRSFNIFDPGLVARTGHYFDFCHVIAQNLIGRGFAVRVYGHRAATPEVAAEFRKIGCTFVGLFSRVGWAPLAPDERVFRRIQAIAGQAACEMASVQRADFHLFPTLTPEQFLAHASVENPPPMAGLVHLEPNSFHPLGGQAWALASTRVRRRKLKVTVGSIDSLIAAGLRAHSGGLPIFVMPIPQGGASRKTYSNTAKTIGFFGCQRRERGLDLIPSLVRRLRAQGYEVVLHDTVGHFGTEGTSSRGHRRGFVGDLCAEMARCDLVVCPMIRSNYTRRLSGIVWNAVASGVPVVLRAGTLPALRISRLRASTRYREHSVDGILAGIQRMTSNYPSFTEGAKRGAVLWKKRHSVDRFVQYILERLER